MEQWDPKGPLGNQGVLGPVMTWVSAPPGVPTIFRKFFLGSHSSTTWPHHGRQAREKFAQRLRGAHGAPLCPATLRLRATLATLTPLHREY